MIEGLHALITAAGVLGNTGRNWLGKAAQQKEADGEDGGQHQSRAVLGLHGAHLVLTWGTKSEAPSAAQELDNRRTGGNPLDTNTETAATTSAGKVSRWQQRKISRSVREKVI